MFENIYITGEIGVSIELKDVIKQVTDKKDAVGYNVYINSIGGYVDTGFDIYNYLTNLNKPINTIGTGYVCSIATVIFLAGDKRSLKSNTEFMIHNPSGGVEGTAEQIENYNEMLKNAENKIIKFYADKTGLSKEALIPLLRNETFLTGEEAVSFGFATEILTETIKASFKINNNKNEKKMDENNYLKNILSSLNRIGNLIKKVKNVKLLDATGVEIDFPSVEDGLTPQVGDAGTIDGQPVADGTYVMPSLNNASVTFVGGVITEIVEEQVEDKEMQDLRNENESLKQQLADATAQMELANTNLANIENEYKNLKKEITAKFQMNVKKQEEQEPIKIVDERLEKLRSKIKK